MKFLFIKNPVFTENQFDRLSTIFDNAGQVIFGIGVVSPIIAGIDKINIFVILSSLLMVTSCWVTSIWFAKRKDIEHDV